MPYFRREGHPVVTVQAFLDLVGGHLPQETLFGSSLFLLVRSFMKLPWPRNPQLVDWMAGLGMREKLFLYLGLSDLP